MKRPNSCFQSIEGEDPSNPDRFAVELFLDKSHAEVFRCAICLEIPSVSRVVEHTRCGSVFCKSCLAEWVQTKPVCPVCRRRFGSHNPLTQSHLALNKSHKQLKLKCTESSCGWTGSLEDFAKHTNECLYTKRKCKYAHGGCDYLGNIEEMKEHEIKSKDFHLELCSAKLAKIMREASKLEDQPANKKPYISLNQPPSFSAGSAFHGLTQPRGPVFNVHHTTGPHINIGHSHNRHFVSQSQQQNHEENIYNSMLDDLDNSLVIIGSSSYNMYSEENSISAERPHDQEVFFWNYYNIQSLLILNRFNN